MNERYVRDLRDLDATRVAEAGGKAAHLGALSAIDGVRVPPGWCVTTAAFRRVMASAAGVGELLDRLSRVDPDDAAAVRALSREVREAVAGAAVPGDLAAEITRAAGPGAYAVRSSATAEDTPAASFAGQQDTYLNVVGPEAVLAHVVRVWASLFTERAVIYRLRNGVDHRRVAMAVVVQRMVLPDASGIMFTADPVTGDRTVTTVDAGFGLGEALVSGLVTPDVFAVRAGTVVARTIAAKDRAIEALPGGGTREVTVDPARRREPALTDAQVLRLAELGRRIEAHFGRPQDIEWCLTGDEIQIVQSRPITTLFPVPAAPAGGGKRVYLSVGHQQMMTDAMRPLGYSMWQLTAMAPMLEAGGRLWVDATPLLSAPAGRAGFLAMAARTDPLTHDALRTLLDRGDVIPAAPGAADGSAVDGPAGGPGDGPAVDGGAVAPAEGGMGGSTGPGSGAGTGSADGAGTGAADGAGTGPADGAGTGSGGGLGSTVAARASARGAHPPHAPAAPIPTDPAIVAELVARGEAAVGALRRGIAGKTGPELFDFLRAAFEEHKRQLADPLGMQAIMAGMEATWWLNDRLGEWLGEPDAADTLTLSAPGNITSEMGLALLDVADVIRPYPEVVAFLDAADGDGVLEQLPKLPGGTEARDAIEAYLGRYGMRCVGEIDITRPRWRERPGTLLPVLLDHVRTQRPGEAARRFEKGRRAAEAKAAEVRDRLRALPGGEEKAAETARMIDRVRTFIGYREYPKYVIIARYLVYKRALLAEAARLFATPEDAFYLTFQELEEAARTGEVDGALIRRRRDEFRAQQRLTPPRVLTSDGEALTGAYRRDDLPPGALAGLPVSAGTVEGRARVVLDLERADLEPGDILVTAHTDPSWTPLFVAVAGLVTEVGGQMTHGAVIAREYGLPAVVSVVDATRLIPDGRRIRVHGTGGYVELLD